MQVTEFVFADPEKIDAIAFHEVSGNQAKGVGLVHGLAGKRGDDKVVMAMIFADFEVARFQHAINRYVVTFQTGGMVVLGIGTGTDHFDFISSSHAQKDLRISGWPGYSREGGEATEIGKGLPS